MIEGTDTIVARATPSGEGAIAIIRISGPKTFSLVRSLTFPLLITLDTVAVETPQRLAISYMFTLCLRI